MTGGANPGSPRLLFAALVQGLVEFKHHSIKKKKKRRGRKKVP